MTDMSAAIGCSQIKHFSGKRRFLNNILFNETLKLADMPQFFNYPIMSTFGLSPFGSVIGLQRSYKYLMPKLIDYLESHGVGTRRYFGGNLLRQPAYYAPDTMENYPNADYLTECVCWVGCHDRMKRKDVLYITKLLIEFAKENR